MPLPCPWVVFGKANVQELTAALLLPTYAEQKSGICSALFLEAGRSPEQGRAGFSGACQSGSSGVIWRRKKQESLNPGDVCGKAKSRYFMSWFLGKWRIPSAFGNEPPRKGLRFDELPRVRELQQKYAQSSDEEVLDAFRNARITDSVLRFFLYTEAKKRQIDSKLSQESHNEKTIFEEGEVIIFRFIENFNTNSSIIAALIITIFIFYLKEYVGIIFTIILLIIVLLCICIFCRIVNRLSYLTNKKIVINDEFCKYIKIIDIKFVEMNGSYISNLSGPNGILLTINSIFYNAYTFHAKNDKHNMNEIEIFPKEKKSATDIYCYKIIIDHLIGTC